MKKIRRSRRRRGRGGLPHPGGYAYQGAGRGLGGERAAGLEDNRGFDRLSHRPGKVRRGTEAKGRVGVGEVELTENEWVVARNQRDRYWLYVVFNCEAPRPRLLRVHDPFGKLIVKAKGSVRSDSRAVFGASEED
jgi:hypothetical protein